MKNLLINSKKLLSYRNGYKPLRQFESSSYFYFTTLKKSGANSIKTVNPQPINNNDQQSNFNDQQSPSQQTKITQNQKQALQMINSYITIDEVKNQPNALKEIIVKQDFNQAKNRLIKALEYNKQNTGRTFYMNNKQKVDKVIFDLKSYNSESEMSTKQILLMFYLCKLASDCGYQHKIDGFELRATIKLNNSIQIVQNPQQYTLDTLTPNETIYGYWLTSKIGCNNHEYKWKTYLMMLNLWTNWKKKISDTYHPERTHLHNKEELSVPPITLSQISSLLEAHFMEEIHLSTEYHIMEFLIENLQASQAYFFTKEQYKKNQNIFIKIFSHLLNIEQHFINGRYFFMLQQVIIKMSTVIENELVQKLNTDDENKKKFLSVNTSRQFLKTADTYSPAQLIGQNKSLTQKSRNSTELHQEQVLKYFIFLNEIRQNNPNFKNISFDHYSKVQFLLFQIISGHFSQLMKDKKEISIQLFSLYTRTWIKKQQFNLEQLQQKLGKSDNSNMKAQLINLFFNQLTTQFNQLIESLATKIDQQLTLLRGTQNQKEKGDVFLKSKEKEQQIKKNIFLKNVEQNFVKPIIDFINANGKSTIMNSTLISSQKLALIDTFEDFLTYFFGQQQQQQKVSSGDNKQQQLETIKMLTSENPYYWMLKYARLQSVYVKDNKLFLKQFESILQKISTNASKENPQIYSIISVYNLYAYLCKLQQKIMLNEESNTDNKEISMECFLQKKEYRNFLLYKSYISQLVFEDSFEKINKNKNQIPKKYRIDEHFNKNIENLQNEKNIYLMKVSLMNKKTGKFNIERFFNIVFRANRYFNHQILCQQVLLHLFGTQDLIKKNLMEYISNTNQRSRQNVFELIYMMLLCRSKEYDTMIPHTLEMKSIKIKIQQCLNDKTKGNLVLETVREVFAPRKTSFLQKTPLKYRLKPYSIFQTVSQKQSLKKKQEILQQFLDIFPSGKSHLFGWVELVFCNIECWGTHRSEIISDVILPWITQKIKNNEVLKATIPYFVLSTLRLLRSSSLRTNPNNQKQFVKFLQVSLPILYENLDKNKKQYHYTPLIGYLLQIQQISKKSKISPKKLYQILVNCKEIIIKTSIPLDLKDSKYFLKLTQTLDRIIESIKNDSNERQNIYFSRKLFSGEQKQSTQKVQKSSKTLFENKKSTKHNEIF